MKDNIKKELRLLLENEINSLTVSDTDYRSKSNESIFEVLENIVTEDYPTQFNWDEFKKLTSFNARVKYCNENLTRISSGSSRIVYKVDETKVLKLAKNKKGIAQNETEISYSNYHDISDIVAKVFEYDNQDLWVEMELAKKVTKPIFKKVIGVDFDDYCDMLRYFVYSNDPKKYSKFQTPKISDELQGIMWENEFVSSMLDYTQSYDPLIGDLMVLTSYGLVKRDGNDDIVLIDYGATNSVYDSYYK